MTVEAGKVATVMKPTDPKLPGRVERVRIQF